jgi:hypothetical protein
MASAAAAKKWARLAPGNFPHADELEVRVVHERGGLERVIGTLHRERGLGRGAELGVDHRQEPP